MSSTKTENLAGQPVRKTPCYRKQEASVNVGLMFRQRLRRWPNIKPTLTSFFRCSDVCGHLSGRGPRTQSCVEVIYLKTRLTPGHTNVTQPHT